MRIAVLLAFVLLTRLALGQGDSTTDTNAPSADAPSKPAASSASAKTAPSSKKNGAAPTAQLQAALDQLTQSNRDLLDLLKKQQGVLEDMQFDRRLQSRQIQSLEERLTNAMYENTQLQNKIDKLEAAASGHPQASTPVASNGTPAPLAGNGTAAPSPSPVEDTPPPPPGTFLPVPETEGAPGTKSWHRLFTLKGSDGKQTDLFHIEGRSWRVLWHNEDPPKLKNTSALFINAFPRDDTIPQKVCAKLGSGGDSTELMGPGNYYLKIEASGGAWECAVEDFK
jgi:hypothetical protein